MNMKEWLASKPCFIGPFIRIPRAEIVEIIALAGFDFAIVDLEHGPIMPNELYPMILAAENRGLALLVRLPSLEEPYFKWVLDLGIHGLMVPHVGTAEEARTAVRLKNFSPEGERSICRFVRAAAFSHIPKEEYLEKANSRALLLLQVEGEQGVRNLPDILAASKPDIIYFGPYDLSQSLGVPGQIWHPKVVREIEKSVALCSSHGVAAGIFTDTPEGVARWAQIGVKLLNYRIDVELILAETRKHLQSVRTSLLPERRG